ncbi:hybrid sensor histidine kinase/response regulator [Paraglaciecola sp. L3A3]|uniref:hybrid sensor histidine kinase/response regulator n=1 Tax=Paraglaciecola sp. L3A3 TaxID=2686358 RepID=UPI00131C759F|nr:ATP-binding protein [Paraglaciecola sp. L3A3]
MTTTVDIKEVGTLINLFTQPVMVVDETSAFVLANHAFNQSSELVANTELLLEHIYPLVSAQQSQTYCYLGMQEKVLDVMPMTQNLKLIKISNNKSDLAKRYNNILSAIDQMSDAVLICDKQGRIDLVNEQFQNTFPVSEINHGEKQNVLSLLLKVLPLIYPQQEKQQLLIYRYLRFKIYKQEECEFTFSLNNQQYFQYRDNITFSGERIALLIDESPFKALTDQLQVAFQEANKLSTAKSTFMAAMSHEVRTPLNALIGLLDLSALEPTLQSHEYIIRMQKSARALLELVNDVLDFSKLDVNKLELNKSHFNLRTLCEDLFEKFSGHAKNKNITLMLFVDPNLPQEIYTDPVRLEQILSNLVSNGLKFNNSLHPELRLLVSLDQLTGYINFVVSDNGIGISDIEKSHIFDTFSQANSNIHKHFGGTGLGLSICRKICQLLQGDIYVESQLGLGSTFTVQLPIESNNEPEIAEINTKIFNHLLISTNDPYFYQMMLLYAPILGFDIKYYEKLPEQIQSTEVIFINIRYTHTYSPPNSYPLQQTIYLDDCPIEHKQNDPQIICSTPIYLSELLAALSHDNNIPANTVTPLNTTIFTPKSLINALVVEDNQDNIYVLKKQFETVKVEVSFATSPEEAIIFFEQEMFNLVISDYQMPVLSGAQLISILREIEQVEQRPKCKMFILTADKSEQCQQELADVTVDKILIKPLEIPMLIELIKDIDIHLQTSNDKQNNSTPNLDYSTNRPANSTFTEQDPSSEKDRLADDLLEDDSLEDYLFIDEQLNHSPPQQHSIMDINRFYQIVGSISQQDTIDYLVGYSKHLADTTNNMQQAVESKNWQALKKLAHSLQSTAKIVGADLLSAECELLENHNSNSNSEQETIKIWNQTEKNINLLLTHLCEYCTNETN